MLDVKKQDYPSVIKLHSGEFKKICQELSTVGDNIEIQTTKDGVKFYTNGDTSEGEIFIRHNDNNNNTDEENENVVLIKQKRNVKAIFSLSFLIRFSKASSICDEFELSISDEFPLLANYKITNLGSIKYYLAPLIK